MRHLFSAFVTVLLLASTAHASILVGTVKTSNTETITEINQLITEYNARFGATLEQVVIQIDKLEDTKDGSGNIIGADFVTGNLSLDQFDFYQESGANIVRTESVFDADVTYANSALGGTTAANSFNNIDANVFGFVQQTDVEHVLVDYYVSKDGPLGWSLWAVADGFEFNPVYTDSGDNGGNVSIPDAYTPSSTDRDGTWTQGDSTLLTTTGLYDPIKNAVSHLSFYGTDDNIVVLPPIPVPEPSALAIWGLGLFTLGAVRRRRKD